MVRRNITQRVCDWCYEKTDVDNIIHQRIHDKDCPYIQKISWYYNEGGKESLSKDDELHDNIYNDYDCLRFRDRKKCRKWEWVCDDCRFE